MALPTAMKHFEDEIESNRKMSRMSAEQRVAEYEFKARQTGSCKLPASEFEMRDPYGSISRGPVYVLWFQDRQEFSYLISAVPQNFEDKPPMTGVSREELIQHIAYVIEDQNRVTYSDSNGSIMGWGPSPDYPNGFYTWQGVGDPDPRLITRESAEDYLTGNGIRSISEIMPRLSRRQKEDVYGETMEAIHSDDFEVTPDQVERHVQQAQQQQKTFGELIRDNIYEVINFGEKQCLGGKRRPSTVDPTVYYMNGKRGTETDFLVNHHVSVFMVFHKSGPGYLKVYFWDNDTVQVMMYRNGEKVDRECTATIAPGTSAKIAGLMKEKADDLGLKDKPLSSIDCRAENVIPLGQEPADNILPFTARS